MADKLTLTELQKIIRDSLYLALPDMYWVIAEISEIKENYSGHCYLELIEKHPDDKNVKARVRANIWSNRYRFLKALFESATGEPLQEGMKLLLRAKVEYHEIYGLSLSITDIDPAYTLGEMAARRQVIIKKLEDEGVFSMNRELTFPVLPQRIAVVSSKNAAGYSDFIRHLNENSQGYVFYTALYEAIMQGNETEKSVTSALERIAERSELFDVVAIIRGGGSQSDLSWFDNYKIAFYITQFPIPVLTGIGHEKDQSVTDLVAFRALKTPTAVANHLIDCVADAETGIKVMSDEISELSLSIIEFNTNLIESVKLKLTPLSRLLISEKKEQLSSCIFELINYGKDSVVRACFIPENQKLKLATASGSFNSAKRIMANNMMRDLINFAIQKFEKATAKITNLEKELESVDPVNVLRRGYTITTLNGRIIKNADLLNANDVIETSFSSGKVSSSILKRIKEKK
jgi:exodeoxyribonuclease VII large subunit